MLLIGAVMMFAVPLLNPLGLWWRLILKSAIIVVFPFVLIPFRYYEAIEKQRLREKEEKQ